MASRTKQKEEARERRMAAERERLRQEQRVRQLRMIGGIVVAAIAVAAVIIAISSAGSSSGLKTGTEATKTASGVESLLTGIPQSGATLGHPNAPVTMYYYGDLECPICRDFTLNGGLSQLIANEVRAGKVKIVYRAFQTATQDPVVFQTQQSAALAAGEQNRFWDYTELFYHEQGQEGTNYVNDAYLTGLANQIPGLNVSQWQSARNNTALAAQVQADIQAGNTAHVTGTPTLIAQGPKGSAQIASGVPSYADLQHAIQQVS
jgi:protein-disulfide isomerase